MTQLTSQNLINAAGLSPLPPGYYDLIPLNDGIGFTVKRRYPDQSPLSPVVTKAGNQNLACLIHFVLDPNAAPTAVAQIRLHARLYGNWEEKHSHQYDFTNPDCPTPDSVNRFGTMSRPLALDFRDDFVYDPREDAFYGEEGPTTGHAILNHVYETHCRTLRLAFRLKWRVLESLRRSLRKAVWRGQDLCLWILEHGYDMKVSKRREIANPFYRFRMSDFERTTETAGTHFFGFQSSKRSLFSNLVVLAVACAGAYWILPYSGFLRAVYRNTALSTAALIFGYLLADQLVPFALKAAVCGLSRLRPATIFAFVKVQV